jgi:hypothetical protein
MVWSNGVAPLCNLDSHATSEDLEKAPYLVIVDGDAAGGPVGDAMDFDGAATHPVNSDQATETSILWR